MTGVAAKDRQSLGRAIAGARRAREAIRQVRRASLEAVARINEDETGPGLEERDPRRDGGR